VVIKTRQHLAAVKPQGKGLMLELMHFAAELVDETEFRIPEKESVGRRELSMAESLIESMSSEWDPEKYHDDYRDALEKMIEDKLEHPDRAAHKAPAAHKPTKVIDLVAVLQKSLEGANAATKSKTGKRGGDGKVTKASARGRRAKHAKAA
jgi:DNA end-binding protein Ku